MPKTEKVTKVFELGKLVENKVLLKEQQVKSVKTRIECRSGLFLAVIGSGVRGIKDGESVESLFLLIPIGLRVVALQNVETELYIGMDSKGLVYTTVSTVIM